jgi:hypothetical protein
MQHDCSPDQIRIVIPQFDGLVNPLILFVTPLLVGVPFRAVHVTQLDVLVVHEQHVATTITRV